MDVERIVVRLVADASAYFRVLDSAQARLMALGGFVATSFARQSIQLAMDYERSAIAFEVMTKSAVRGKKLLDDINRLAVDTPFTSAEIQQTAKQVMAFGFQVDDVIPVVSRLGDISIATGTDMDRLSLALGQVRTTGRLMGQELRQFTNAGVPILEYLAKTLQVTSAQVPQLVRQGKISYGDVASAINKMTSEGGIFFGMMDRVNKETISGRWANLRETMQLTARNIGLAAFQAFRLNRFLSDVIETLGGVNQSKAGEVFASIRLGAYAAWQWLTRLYEVIVRNQTALKYFAASVLLINGIGLAVTIASWAMAWGAWLIPILLVNSAIGYLLYSLDALEKVNLEGMLSRLTGDFEKMSSSFKTAWKGIQDAIAGNDMKLAFEIFEETLSIGLLSIRVRIGQELNKLAFTIQTEVNKVVGVFDGTGLHLINPMAAGVLNKLKGDPNRFLKQNAVLEQSLNQRQQQYEQRIKNLAIQSKIRAALPMGEDTIGKINAGVFDAYERPDFNESEFRRSVIGENRSGVGGAIMQARLSELLQSALEISIKIRSKVTAPELNTELNLEALQKEASETAAKIDRLRSSIKQMAKIDEERFRLSPQALHAASELQKDFDRGTSAIDRYRKEMNLLTEAFEGPLRSLKDKPEFGAVMGMPALMGNPGAALTPEAFDFGQMKSFMQLQREVGNSRERYSPVMVRGSREAAETIIRSNDQSLSVEQQVLQTLREGNIVRQQQAAYSKQVLDTLRTNKEAVRAAGLGGNQ